MLTEIRDVEGQQYVYREREGFLLGPIIRLVCVCVFLSLEEGGHTIYRVIYYEISCTATV